MKRIAPIALALLLLAGCERTPEPPPPAPKTEVVAPAPAVVTPPAEVPVPLPTPEIVVPPAPRPVKVVEVKLPRGFVRLGSGSVMDAGGQLRQTASFAIAREPVINAQLREWAESEGGRRLPQLLGASDAAVATDLDWLAADAYARWLSARDKRHYRLPTELEWRRAAQSGRVLTQAQRQPAEPPLWEWTGDCWGEDGAAGGSCASRVLVGGEDSGTDGWGRAPMGGRRPAASFRLVLDLK